MSRPDFPRTLPEFIRRFPDERAAFEYMIASRWPGGTGFVCPKCRSVNGFPRTDRLAMQCASRSCQTYTSATAGTAMHRSKMSLTKWLLAAWLLVTDKRGLSTAGLARQLGTTHETAYMMLHKLRAAMVAPERTRLAGLVEVDETYLGAPPRGRDRKDVLEKILVAGAVEVRTGKDKRGKVITFPGRVRLAQIAARNKTELVGFVANNVEPGSVVVTDGLSHYKDVELVGYHREIESVIDGLAEKDVLRHFHLVVSNLKAYLQGTYHGGVSAKHLQAYLNEFTFRFNRRGNPQAAFQTVLGIASRVRGPTYVEIYTEAGVPGGWEHPGSGWRPDEPPL